MSNAYLSRYLKKNLGMNFIDYLNNVRLHYAVENLLYNDTTITRASLDNGFANTAVFNKLVPTWGVFMDKEQQGRGPLIDIGTHALDITLWCMNNYDVESISGSVFYKLGGLQQATEGNLFGPWNPETFEVEDSEMGFVKMKNGATINLEASWALNILESREASTDYAEDKTGIRADGTIDM